MYKITIFLIRHSEQLKINTLLNNSENSQIANEKIILSFIKGVDKKDIYDYRVMITGKIEIPEGIKENAIINMATRFHQMNCNNDNNIKILEEVIS